MMHTTHAALSTLTGLIFIKIFPFDSIAKTTLFLCLVIIIGTIPDIDHEKSRISKRFRKTSHILRLVISHRGFMHSVYPAIIFYLLLQHFGYPTWALGVTIGYLSHLLGDAITTEGVNFLNPFLHLKIEGFIHSGTIMETVVLIILLIANGVMIYSFLLPYVNALF